MGSRISGRVLAIGASALADWNIRPNDATEPSGDPVRTETIETRIGGQSERAKQEPPATMIFRSHNDDRRGIHRRVDLRTGLNTIHFKLQPVLLDKLGQFRERRINEVA